MSGHKRRSEFRLKDCNVIETPVVVFSESTNSDLPPAPLLEIDIDADTISDNLQENVVSDLAPAPCLAKASSSFSTPSVSCNIPELNSTIKKSEALFALKCSSKYLLTREQVNDIFSFSGQMQSLKLELIKAYLHEQHADENDLNIRKVTETIDLINHVAGHQPDQLLSHYMREKILHMNFEFIEPKVTRIGY